ncbi:hypothetical protein CK203_014514 [Vitis vinifera]|uniref:Uncharacterized protein n=1 Tax=Vitis vinifera TaxID=29760 RepID=A0A438K4L5_VITVI|nr:hypothetical protein CK203_014514 [Vitis vinifera]
MRTLKFSVDRKAFLVRFEGESGGTCRSLTEHSKGSVFALGFETEEVGWLIEHLAKAIELKSYMGFNRKYRGKSRVYLMELKRKGNECKDESIKYKHVGPMYRSFVSVVKEEGPRRGGLVPIGRWTRAMVCECPASFVNWVEELRFLKVKGGYTIQLRRWSPRENTEVLGKFRGGWIELQGLPFHLWYEEHLKKIVKQWGMVIEIDWRMVKLFDLSKARVRILMKERTVLPALIEVIDGGWVFTISVAVVGAEDERRVRGMGESTRGGSESCSWTSGRRPDEKANPMAKGWSFNEDVDRIQGGVESQKAKDASKGTCGKSATMGNNCIQPSSPFNLNSNKEGNGSFGPKLFGEDWAERGASAPKFGLKKLWTSLSPPTSGCRQGIRRRSKPLSQEVPTSAFDVSPWDVAFEVGSEKVRKFNSSPLTSSCPLEFQRSCSREGASSTSGVADNQQRLSLKATIQP